MIKKIKTVKELRKHIGKTVQVVTENGYTFDAVVEMEKRTDNPYPVLYTTDKAAAKSRYWWGGIVFSMYGHSCANDYQITDELKSLTVITDKKTKKKKPKYLTKDELDAARGHFCLLEDGSKGFICVKTESEYTPTRVLHNSSDSRGWEYTNRERYEDNAPESIKYTFSKAWNANDEKDAVSIKVIEVLEKYDGRKYRFKKAKKESPKTVEAPKSDEESVKTIETPKTILDMTIKEVLEKLDEIIKC